MSYVLIINRDPHPGTAIVAALAEEGVEGRLATSESEAVSYLQEERPELILWDWPATDISGEIFVALLRQERYRGPLVVCSRSFDLGGLPYDALVWKPFAIERLASTISRLVMAGETEDQPCSSR